ncbi:hypothetical protein KUE10_30045, partial [Klebsiella variicola]|nr:hypothetical protein [Klebsiella variicola]
IVGGPVGDFELLLCHGTVCVVGKMRDLILQLSKSSIYSTKPCPAPIKWTFAIVLLLIQNAIRRDQHRSAGLVAPGRQRESPFRQWDKSVRQRRRQPW